MVIKFKKKDVELKYTFNSFRYMEDFDITVFDELEKKPFKVVNVLTMLLMGALNWTPKNKYTLNDVSNYLEELTESDDGSLAELLTELMELLEKSPFFKSLQAK